MVRTEYKISGEDRSIVTDETAEFTTSEPPAEPSPEPTPEPIQGVVESSSEGNDVAGPGDAESTSQPANIHKQRALRALEQRRQLKSHG